MAASWRPACFRLRIGSTSISDPSKSTRVGVGGLKLNLLLLNECFSAEVDAARSRRRLDFGVHYLRPTSLPLLCKNFKLENFAQDKSNTKPWKPQGGASHNDVTGFDWKIKNSTFTL